MRIGDNLRRPSDDAFELYFTPLVVGDAHNQKMFFSVHRLHCSPFRLQNLIKRNRAHLVDSFLASTLSSFFSDG